VANTEQNVPPLPTSSGATRQWYVLIGDREFGPLALDRLAVIAANGRLQRDDLVWRSGYTWWVAAEQVAGLFPPAVARGPTAEPASARAQARAALPGIAAPAPSAAVAPEAGAQAGSGNASGAAVELGGQKAAGYLTRHWRGELSLTVSFWVNSVVGNAVITVAGLLASSMASTGFAIDRATALAMLCCLTCVVTAAWVLVGTWRSAIRYGRHHPTGYWDSLAKLALGIMVVWIAGQVLLFAMQFFPNPQQAAPTPLIPPNYNRFQR
jgi:hypothetical protein